MFVAAIAHSYAFPPEEYNMGQQVLPRKFSENVLELFDVRDVYQDIKNFAQQQRDRFTGKYKPGVASPVPSNRASGSRHNQTGDAALVNMAAAYDKSLESVEAETLLSRGANTNNFADDQFDVIVSGGSAEGGAIVIDSVSSDGGLAPLNAERPRAHDV